MPDNDISRGAHGALFEALSKGNTEALIVIRRDACAALAVNDALLHLLRCATMEQAANVVWNSIAAPAVPTPTRKQSAFTRPDGTVLHADVAVALLNSAQGEVLVIAVSELPSDDVSNRLQTEPATAPPKPLFAFEDALDRLGGDMEFVRETVGVFTASTPTGIANLQSAIDAADWEKAARLAHTLKGAAATAGAAMVRLTALEIEQRIKNGQTDHINLFIPQLHEQLAAFAAAAAGRLEKETAERERPA